MRSFLEILCAMAILAVSANAQEHVELFVSINGNDASIGSSELPLATLTGARDRVRELRQKKPNHSFTVTVVVKPGVYQLDRPLEFGEHDSGDLENIATFRAETPGTVIIRGGRSLDKFRAAEASSKHRFPTPENVWQIDLSAHGDSLIPARRSLHSPMSSSAVGIVHDGNLLTYARWPNSSWSKTQQVSVADRNWHIDENLLADNQQAENAWVHAFWENDWEDGFERVSIHNKEGRTCVTLLETAQHSVKEGSRFRIENLASQLDSPGEWFVDMIEHQGYVYSENGPPQGAFTTELHCPVSFYGVSNFHFIGFVIDGARDCGIEIAGGQSVVIDHCNVRHISNTGIHVFHGKSHVVRNCEIENTGAGGIRVEGGDRRTLSSCGHQLLHNHIHDFSHRYLAYRPAVNVIGVGVSVVGNRIEDGPHSAIILEGNEHSLVSNTISQVCLETDDVGAIYLGGDPTYRGNKIEENYIHNIGSAGRLSVIGIYLDDFASGTLVRGNRLQDMVRGIVIGGGRDNVIDSNIIVDCQAAIQMDGRGTTWAKDFVAGEQSVYHRHCTDIDCSGDVYSKQYPELASVLQQNPQLPLGNRIYDNWIDSRIGIDYQAGIGESLVDARDNVHNALQYLVDLGDGQFEMNERGLAMLESAEKQPEANPGSIVPVIRNLRKALVQ